MFGTVKPYMRTLNEENRKEYQKYYCGLCMALGKVSGVIAKFILSNDLTFAYIILDSLFDGHYDMQCRCIAKCGRKKNCIYNPSIADYVASMNLVLAYKKLEDDIADDNSRFAKILCRILSKDYQRIKHQYLEGVEKIEKALEYEYELEHNGASYVELADSFGQITRIVFTEMKIAECEKAALAGLGEWIGRWIYVADAWADYDRDIKEDNFNPLKEDGQDHLSKEKMEELKDYLSDCQLHMQEYVTIIGLKKNQIIIDNILNDNMDANIGTLLKKEEQNDKK